MFIEKSGCEIGETSSLVKHVIENCKNLKFVGIMTIGAYGYDPANGLNPDFLALKTCRQNISHDLSLDLNNIKLSMGMSTDYEHAVSVFISNYYISFIKNLFYDFSKLIPFSDWIREHKCSSWKCNIWWKSQKNSVNLILKKNEKN